MNDELITLQRGYCVAGVVAFAILYLYFFFNGNLIALANFFMVTLGFLPFETVLSEKPLFSMFWIAFAIGIGAFISTFFVLVFGLIAAGIHDRIANSQTRH